MEERNLLILFGGQSSEHEISCFSAVNVIHSISRLKYNIYLVGITKEGRWVYTDHVKQIEDGSWIMGNVSAVLSPDATKQCLYLFEPQQVKEIHIDVAFPILHGLYGEDGTVQGIFELSGIPYVGAGVTSSALCMDKLFTKIVAERLAIRQANHQEVRVEDLADEETLMRRIELAIGYPMFVKPSRSGSSRGVRKVLHRNELMDAIRYAAGFDSKILVEEAISGRELECAVFGTNTTVIASGVGEIVTNAQFYDFDAKYNNADSRTDTSPELPDEVREEIRDKAVKLFRALDCYSLARVDFFLDDKGVVFNEINTIPGFTSISMYPMLFEAIGVSKRQLVADLIETAFYRKDRG